jgi:hypothetical protein
VEAFGGGAPVEIGRVGVFPDRGFTAAEPHRTQRFSLQLPESVTAARLRSVAVRIEPTVGTGREARAEVTGRLVFRP